MITTKKVTDHPWVHQPKEVFPGNYWYWSMVYGCGQWSTWSPPPPLYVYTYDKHKLIPEATMQEQMLT